jgi:hypothetical protein
MSWQILPIRSSLPIQDVKSHKYNKAQQYCRKGHVWANILAEPQFVSWKGSNFGVFTSRHLFKKLIRCASILAFLFVSTFNVYDAGNPFLLPFEGMGLWNLDFFGHQWYSLVACLLPFQCPKKSWFQDPPPSNGPRKRRVPTYQNHYVPRHINNWYINSY